jgi:hypothetical protein
MAQSRDNAAETVVRFVKETQLVQYRRTVVVDPLAGKPVGGIERVDTA